MFEVRDGFTYPTAEKGLAGDATSINDLEEHIYPLVKEFNVAVQAGGALGMWPLSMGKVFETVYTFEPNPELFHCLVRNAPGLNILKYQAALGDKRKQIHVTHRKVWNYGAYRVHDGGDIPIMRVDDLQLGACDLLMLDIEGYELYALEGAFETIKAHRPLIVFESKPVCFADYNYSVEQIHALLKGHGYKHVKDIHGKRDEIWSP